MGMAANASYDESANRPFIGTALWLIPKKGSPLYEALRSIISGIQPLFDDGVVFEPHITLTTNIHAPTSQHVEYTLDQAAAAAKAAPFIDVKFTKLCYGSRYFQKVYFSVAPSPYLLSLARICREEFVVLPQLQHEQKNYHGLSDDDKQAIMNHAGTQAARWVKEEYQPHVSLVYSNTYPVDEASQRTIESRLADVFGPDFEQRGLGWTGGRLALVRCEGPVEEWPTLGYRDL